MQHSSLRAHVVVVLALLAYLALALGYATRTPIWQNPDEPAHFNYVAHVASTATLPELRPGDWDSELLERLKSGRLTASDSVAAIRYESWQPPLAYLLGTPVLRFGASDSPGPTARESSTPTDSAARSEGDPLSSTDVSESSLVLRLRLLGIALGGLTLIVGFLAAREVLPPLLASAVPVVMAGVPMFTAVSASVSADPLANLLAATLVLALLRRLRGSGLLLVSSPAVWSEQSTLEVDHGRSGVESSSWPDAALGALLGLGLLTKLALGIFVPLAVVVVLARADRPLRNVAILLAAMVLVISPWLIHQVTTYGWSDPLAITRHAQVVADQPRPAEVTGTYVLDFLTITFHSFWAQFGWMAIPASTTLYWIWGGLVMAASIGLMRNMRLLRQPAWLLLLATAAAAAAALVAYNLSFTQFQGRYLFPALAPIATLLTVGWSTLLPRRFSEAGVLAAAWLLVALNAYTFLRVLTPAFA